MSLITPERLPLLAKFSADKRDGLQSWFQSRSIPKARRNLEKLLAHAGVKTANALSLKETPNKRPNLKIHVSTKICG